MKVNIQGLDKEIVLMELFNNSLGSLIGEKMDYKTAHKQFEENGSLGWDFDYVLSVPIKTNLSSDIIDLTEYSEYYGENVALTVIRKLENIK